MIVPTQVSNVDPSHTSIIASNPSLRIRHVITRSHAATINSPPDTVEASFVSQALKISHWRYAICDEFNALIRNGTWVRVATSSSQNVVFYK